MLNRSDEFWEGYDAYQDGQSRDSNPYPNYLDEPRTQPRDDWHEGWDEAAWDD